MHHSQFRYHSFCFLGFIRVFRNYIKLEDPLFLYYFVVKSKMSKIQLHEYN